MKFLVILAAGSPFRARAFIARRDSRTLATDILAFDQQSLSAAFRKLPMARANLRGLQRSAVVMLGNVGTDSYVPLLETMHQQDDPLLREHAAWALARKDAGYGAPHRMIRCGVHDGSLRVRSASTRVLRLTRMPARASTAS